MPTILKNRYACFKGKRESAEIISQFSLKVGQSLCLWFNPSWLMLKSTELLKESDTDWDGSEISGSEVKRTVGQLNLTCNPHIQSNARNCSKVSEPESQEEQLSSCIQIA